MRGIIFTEYMQFVSDQISEEDLDLILTNLDGSITGSYTSVGNYSFDEFALIHTEITNFLAVEPYTLAREFGRVLMGRFETLFPTYFEGVESGLQFLEKVGSHIHEEVVKLYPDAVPPQILVRHVSESVIELTYRSHRPLSAVAHGLTEACLVRFNDPVKIASYVTNGNETVFQLEKS